MQEITVRVLENTPLCTGVCKMIFELPAPVEGIACGKFVNISTGDGAHLLRRPIAVCEHTESTVTICYQIKGSGTQALSRVRAGDTLSCVLPLGNGFWLDEGERRVALIGGGVGIFPMLSVLSDYAGKGKHFDTYFGFRTKAAVCMEGRAKALSETLTVVTDDGSYGQKTNAVAAFFADAASAQADVILACGPLPMLRALKEGLAERGMRTPCYVSLEERMGCGIGACLVCVCKKQGAHVRVCKDGPVFAIGEVEL